LVLCTACASFAGGELPAQSLSELESQQRLPAISYELRSAVTPNLSSPNLVGPNANVERVFRKAFAETRSGPADNDLHVDLFYESRTRQPIFTMGLAFFTICSLGIIPTYGYEDLTFEARVTDKGNPVAVYEYHDHIETWVHLVMIPWAYAHDPTEIEDRVFENMLLNFIHDLRRDLSKLAPGEVPAQRSN
jgi:hypothetical protein